MMTERQKVLLRLTIFLTLCLLFGVGLFFLFFRDTPDTTPDDERSITENSGGNLLGAELGSRDDEEEAGTDLDGDGRLDEASPIADGGLTIVRTLTSGEVTSPETRADGTVAYYDQEDGRFYRINNDGETEALSEKQFPDAQTVTFAKGATKVALEFPDGSNVLYDFNSNKQVSLPSHWTEFDFTEDGASVVSKSLGNDPSNRSLVMTAADGSETRVIVALGESEEAIKVSVSPDASIVGFSKTGGGGSSFGQNQVYLISDAGEASSSLIINGTSFKDLWSPDTSHLIYSVADPSDDYRASLWYADKRGDRKGDTRLRLSIKTTAEKCVFASGTSLYCAVPKTMPVGGGVGGAALKDTDDELYKVSLPDGKSSRVAVPAIETSMNNLRVSENGEHLYFTDNNGRLALIRLR